MKFIFILLTVFSSTIMMAQYAETMRTARPGKSVGAFAVGKNILQFQQGLGFQERKEKNYLSGQIYSDYYSSNVIRYGISRKFEISALIDYAFTSRRSYLGNEQNLTWNHFRNLDIGGRYNILEGLNGTLAWGVQARLGFANTLWYPEFPHIKITTSLAKRLKYFALMANVGYNQSEMNPDQLSFTLQFRIPVNDNFGFMLETIGNYNVSRFANNTSFDPFLDGGFWYYLNNDIQLDFYGGYRQTSNQYYFHSAWFIETGISWRLNFND